MSIKRPGFQTSQDIAFTLRARPIGPADLALVQFAMNESAPQWSVELQGICADEANLVILPDDGDDAIGPSFVISREAYGFRLDQVHWDILTEVGVFVSMNGIVDALRLCLAFCTGVAAPNSVTLH